MEYLVKNNKKARILKLKRRNMKITNSENQYVVSIKEDTAYPCLHLTKGHEGNKINTLYPENPIRRIQNSSYLGLRKKYRLSLKNDMPPRDKEIKKVNEKVYVAQVGCEQCKGPHYTKYCPLKEEGKTIKEAYYTQFGAPLQGEGYRAVALGFYQKNNANPSYQERRPYMEENLSKFMSGSAKGHEKNSNMIKEIRASTDATIRNQGALIKILEIQIRQMSKNSKQMNETRQTTISFLIRLNDYYCEEEKGKYGLQFMEANSYRASHVDNTIPRKEKDPGSFTLPCYINNVCFDNALADLGASVSVMPLSAYLNLRLGELAHTKLTMELADRTVKYPKGIAKNVLVGIGKVVFLVDFIILDMPEDSKVPLILGRPFLSTAHSKNDDKLEYKGNDVVRALMNIPIFVGTFFVLTDFAVLEDMGAYRDEGMGEVIFGEPFLREVRINARWFEGIITIYNGNDEVTYKLVRSHLRFKCHTNKQCNKIMPLLKVSEEDKMNGISYSYQKLKSFYKEDVNNVKIPTTPKISHSRKKGKPSKKLTTLNLVHLFNEGDIKQLLWDSTKGTMQTLRASVSVMTLSTYLNLGLGELAHTKLIVELVDKTAKYPKGIVESVLVGIGKFVFPADFIILGMPEDIKVNLIFERPFLSIVHAKIDVFKRKITLKVREEKIIFKSIKPDSSLIKRVYMLSLRERMEPDLEVRLIGETLVLNRSLHHFFDLNDLNVPLELRRDQVDDLMPIIEEGKVIEEVRARNDTRMVSNFFGYPSDYDHDKKIRIDCAHNLKFSCMIGFEFLHANCFPILYVNVISKKFHNSIMKDKLEYKGNNVVGALMNEPIFVGTFSILTDFAVLNDMDAYRD
nr:hypothetical protein [Tanacetum cinerariifolium]